MTRPERVVVFKALLHRMGGLSRVDNWEAVMVRFDFEISGTARGSFSRCSRAAAHW
jgi:hypothetical protein